MKKVNVSIEPKVWKEWRGTPTLRKACSFPFSFLEDVARIGDGEKTLESFIAEFGVTPAGGVDKQAILRTFRNSHRMTASVQYVYEYCINVDLFLYEPGKKEWSFCLMMMFFKGSSKKTCFTTTPWK
ncbi:MAG: hypothetical protein KBD17_00455 [Candidatus Pacebacteria bacterium]|nr:hypothetical protein [Candidatus Paceibacterota bacterium]